MTATNLNYQWGECEVSQPGVTAGEVPGVPVPLTALVLKKINLWPCGHWEKPHPYLPGPSDTTSQDTSVCDRSATHHLGGDTNHQQPLTIEYFASFI